MRTINKIIIHCTATPLNTSVDCIRNYHLSLGYKDIGYHYLIDKDGNIINGRSVEKIGAHCKGHNKDSIGVALIGGKDQFDFTFDQILSLLALTKRLSNTYKIPKSFIFTHNDFNKNKACPRFNVQNFIQNEEGYYKKGS